jgi:hypothetical protein
MTSDSNEHVYCLASKRSFLSLRLSDVLLTAGVSKHSQSRQLQSRRASAIREEASMTGPGAIIGAISTLRERRVVPAMAFTESA